MLKNLRNLVRNGNSTHVALPPQILEKLRWRAGDALALEITDTGTLTIRRATGTDLLAPRVPEAIDANLQPVSE